MTRLASLLTLLLLLPLPLCAGTRSAPATNQDNRNAPDDALRRRVMAILEETPLIDGHIDVPWQYRRRANLHIDQIDFHDTTKLDPPMHTDLARLKEGGLGAAFWSVYVPAPETGGGSAQEVLTTFEQIDFVKRLAAKYPDHLEIALTADDVVRIHGQGKIASMMGMEGGHSIGNSLGALRQLYHAGARYMTLTHSKNTRWADSANDEPVNDGLSRFGEEVVREMNRLGMLVDLSHVSPATMHDALNITEAPVIFSHSSALGRTDNPRNIPDDVLRRLKENGGVAMVTFFPAYVSNDLTAHNAREREVLGRLREQYAAPDQEEQLQEAIRKWREENPAPWPTLAMVADHIDHVRDVAGIDHIGLGSDYDGMPPGPVGLEDVSTYPNLFVELLKRGYSEADLRKIAGENVLRAMREAEQVAARLQKERAASDATLEELDTAGELMRPAGR